MSGALIATLILVVDDEPTMCRAIIDVLSDQGYAVVAAGDGRSGLALAVECRPHLVLADIVMPGLSGPELLAQLRIRGLRMPVVLMSAVTRELPGVAVPILRKPFDIELLDELLADTLG